MTQIKSYQSRQLFYAAYSQVLILRNSVIGLSTLFSIFALVKCCTKRITHKYYSDNSISSDTSALPGLNDKAGVAKSSKRTFCSNSFAITGFSCKNFITLFLPWPI